MTTILGIQGETFALICVDSRISSFDSSGSAYQVNTLKEGSGKVAVNGKYLLGAAGDVRAINILHHVFQPPIPAVNLKGKKLDQFFTAKFIPSLRQCFENEGYAIPDKEDKEHMAEQASQILVVIHGSIYVVDGDYSWTSDSSGLYALGTGSSYALGALQALQGPSITTPQQAKKIALKAMTIAAKYDPYTGAPFHTFVQEL
jgi:ATP-dependent protease HslVU (ClpYQ) peptidase subunit